MDCVSSKQPVTCSRGLQVLSSILGLIEFDSFLLSLLSLLSPLQVLDHSLHGVDQRLGTGVVELVLGRLGIRDDVVVHGTIGVDEIETREIRTIYG